MGLRAKRRLKRSVLGLMAFALCFVTLESSSFASEKKQKEKTSLKMESMTVISTQPGVEITPEKTVIKMDEFTKPSGVRTLTDVLTEIGGVDVMRINPLMASPGDEVSMRGLNEGRMVIEIDGRRINHTGHFGRYIVDWSSLNMDDVEKIEIIRGGHSVLHPFAIGGVINVITKKGRKTKTAMPKVKVKGGYGSFDTQYQALSLDGGAFDFIGYSFSASNNETDGYLRNNFQKNKSINGRLSFFLPKDMKLVLGVKHSNVEYGYPVLNDPSRSDWDPSYPIFKGTADQLRHIPPTGQLAGPEKPYWDRDVTYLDAIFEAPTSNGLLKVHAFSTEGKRWNHYYRMGNFMEDYSADITRGVIAEYRDLQLFDIHKLTFGLEYQQLGTPDDANKTIGWPKMDDSTYTVKSLYAQDVISLGKFTITPGVRYYSVDMDTSYAWFETGGQAPAWPTGGKTQTEEGFYPSLKVDYQATADTALYAAVSRSYRLPCP